MLANKDIRLYGEVILDNGAFRSVGGFSFTSSHPSVIASFRTKDTNGGPVGTEVAQIDATGTVSAANFTATAFITGFVVTATYSGAGPSGGRKGEMLVDEGGNGIWVNYDGTTWVLVT